MIVGENYNRIQKISGPTYQNKSTQSTRRKVENTQNNNATLVPTCVNIKHERYVLKGGKYRN